MNYSASDDYHDKCRKIDKKRIPITAIKKRWFRNFYVLYQSSGYFSHNAFVMEGGLFNPNDYSGTYYGPFTAFKALDFANFVKNTHLNFILGG